MSFGVFWCSLNDTIMAWELWVVGMGWPFLGVLVLAFWGNQCDCCRDMSLGSVAFAGGLCPSFIYGRVALGWVWGLRLVWCLVWQVDF